MRLIKENRNKYKHKNGIFPYTFKILCVILILIIVKLIANKINLINFSNLFWNLENESLNNKVTYSITKIYNNKCDILVDFESSTGIEYIKYIDSENKEVILDCNKKLSVGIDYYNVENYKNYYFTVKRDSEGEKVENIYVEIPIEQEIDFVSKMTESTFTQTGNTYYNMIQQGGAFFSSWPGLTTYPNIYSSDTGAYNYMFSKNILGEKLKRIEIDVRTRNDGTNWGPASIGIVSNPGTNPTWIEGAYTNWNAALTSSWTQYKTTINIPDNVDTSNCFFEIYLGHVGHAYTMWMDFQNLKGYYY